MAGLVVAGVMTGEDEFVPGMFKFRLGVVPPLLAAAGGTVTRRRRPDASAAEAAVAAALLPTPGRVRWLAGVPAVMAGRFACPAGLAAPTCGMGIRPAAPGIPGAPGMPGMPPGRPWPFAAGGT